MTDKNGMNRRDFLRLGGMAAMTLPAATAIGHFGGVEVVSSAEAYGGFYVRRHEPGEAPYQIDMSRYERPSLKAFMAGGGPSGPGKELSDKPGFTRVDYAYAFAAGRYMLSDYPWKSPRKGRMVMGGGDPFSLPRWDPAEEGYSAQDVTDMAKRAALFYGASLAGVALVDERWFYADKSPPIDPEKEKRPQTPDPSEMPTDVAPASMGAMPEFPKIIFSEHVKEPVPATMSGDAMIPRSMKYLIVMAHEMDADAYSVDTCALSMAASWNGYSRMWFTATVLADFIQALGYNAIPMGNDTALSQPMAVDAGLGELSRSGLLITPKYGPRVRLCKVLTDMPLIPDSPISFGVWEFCEICAKCADFCPSKAIPGGNVKPSYDAPPSGNPGALKWAVNGAACQNFWLESGAECHTCIRVCPFTKPDGWLHDITKTFIGVRSDSVNKLILKMDDAAGFGKEVGKDPREYWKMGHYIHVKG